MQDTLITARILQIKTNSNGTVLLQPRKQTAKGALI